jgi:hypothetical protein
MSRNLNRPFDGDFAKLPVVAKTYMRAEQGLQFM